jgi:hypothetical protein
MLSLPIVGVMLAGVSAPSLKNAKRWALLLLLCLVLLMVIGCGVAPDTKAQTPPPVVGTPAGTYPITVTGTSTGFTATATFNLVVQ